MERTAMETVTTNVYLAGNFAPVHDERDEIHRGLSAQAGGAVRGHAHVR